MRKNGSRRSDLNRGPADYEFRPRRRTPQTTAPISPKEQQRRGGDVRIPPGTARYRLWLGDRLVTNAGSRMTYSSHGPCGGAVTTSRESLLRQLLCDLG